MDLDGMWNGVYYNLDTFRSRFLTEDVFKWRQEMFSAMEKDPLFRRDGPATMGLQEERAKAFRQCVKALALIGETMDPFERKSKLVALQMYDPSLEVKVALLKDMPISAIMGSGTQGPYSIGKHLTLYLLLQGVLHFMNVKK